MGNQWSLGRGAIFRQIDQNLGRIRFPLDFQRGIPSLEHLNIFKAFELKNLILYGFIPCVKDPLHQRSKTMDEAGNFLHWAIIYHEISVRLNSDSIVIDSLPFVDKLIDVWQQLVPQFLGVDGQTDRKSVV